MNLYAVGCSFTHGHGALPGPANVCKHGDFVVNTHGKFDYAWPWQLESHFDAVINDGYQGAGNDYVLRRTLRMLAHLDDADLKDWVFVIQTTQPERKEFLDGVHNMFYKTLFHSLDDRDNTGLDTHEHVVYAQHESQKVSTDINLSQLQCQHASGFYYYCWDDEYMVYDHLKDLLLLINVLENRRCKYLISGMTATQFVPEHIISHYNTENDYSHEFAKLIKTQHHIKCFSEILHTVDPHEATHTSPCYHPNELGHREISSYILNEIKQRGWL